MTGRITTVGGSLHSEPTIRQIEYLLLPCDTKPMFKSDYSAGPHTLIISGYAAMDWEADADDDDYSLLDVTLDIPLPIWSRNDELRTSTLITVSDFSSPDADEVDHSRWAVERATTGHYDEKIAPSEEGAAVYYLRRLRVFSTLGLQGEYNRLKGFGFRIAANGTLLNANEVWQNTHQSAEIQKAGIRSR